MRLLPLCCLTLLAGVAAAGDAVLDIVIHKERGPRSCWVVGEDADVVRYRLNAEAGTENKWNRRDIRRVTYAFERQAGAWSQAVEARERGKFAESAELFGQLSAGDREAEQVVGSFEAGASWELDGNLAQAAASFAKVVDKFPAHPLALDARYRLGVVLALAKDAKAEALIKKLEEDAKNTKLGQQANVRAAGIRAAVALAKGDNAELRRMISKASFSPESDRDAWLHFNLFVADALRASGQGKDAAQIYERMLPQLNSDPASAARVRLGIGLGKIDGDRQGAITALLLIDALPNGSPEQKCEARYHAGRLLWAEVQAMKDSASDERKAAFAADSLATARLLLQAAAESTATHPSKALAAEVLKSLPPEAGDAATDVKPAADPKAAPEKKPEAEAKPGAEKKPGVPSPM